MGISIRTPESRRVSLDLESFLSKSDKFGENDDVSTTEEIVWDEGGLYPGTTVPGTYLTAASVMKISSSSANDASAGTGARTVKLFGLDANFDAIEEAIILNGQTSVNTVNSYLRTFRMEVITRGDAVPAVNDGDIYAGLGTITAGVPTEIFAKITAGRGSTLMAVFTVPAGHTLLIESSTFSNAGKTAVQATFRMCHRDNAISNPSWNTEKHLVISGQVVQILEDPPIAITEKSDIEIRCTTDSGAGAPISAEWNGILVKVR